MCVEMASERGSKIEKNQNIQVFVRLRPLNQREHDIRSLGVVEVVNGKEVVVRQSQQTSHTKRFTFDRAFGPHSKQVEIYQEVVSPLIEEVLAGYNCTVFAYGQTGTGKTHTMVGESMGAETNWQNDPLAGIIPRSLSQLFDELRLTNTEYTVRVSYLELYNEELFDLLATSHDNSKLRIYEDVSRKGSNIVNGLEEITVYNKNEVYKIMSQGQERKRVASTLMNAQSSRSHTVFTIVVHMKENSPEGEELMKIGKLNLVDLAGSENISKAGSDNPAKRERARECVNINQSLLTLGRVITALVERHPHIPYRESKLTRILQESLGGRTKTSIIATVSPGHKDLEETMSTLEYANRAKNIQNKPEVNQKMTKKAILKEYAEEIDRLKRDLQAARDKNGVYLANETYAEMTFKQEEQRKEIQELLLRKRVMEEERDRMESVFSDSQQKLQQRESELNNTIDMLNNTKMQLSNTCNILQTTRTQFEEQKQLLEFQKKIERELTQQAKQILAAADQATSHLQYLHDAFDKRKSVEARNAEAASVFLGESAQRRVRLLAAHDSAARQALAGLLDAAQALDRHTAEDAHIYEDCTTKLKTLLKNATEAMELVREAENKLTSYISDSALRQQKYIETTLDTNRGHLHDALEKSAENAVTALNSVAELELPQAVAACLDEWGRAGREAVGRARSRGAASAGGGRALGGAARAALGAHASQRARHSRALLAAAAANRQLIMEDEEYTEKILCEQLAEIESEKAEAEARLGEWAREERRLLEERIARHVQAEQRALDERLQDRRRQLEEQRRQARERSTHAAEWLEALLGLNRQEAEAAERDSKRDADEIDEHVANIDKLSQECDEEINSVSASMELLSVNVLNVVDQVRRQMVEALNEAAEKIKTESNSMTSSSTEVTQQLSADLARSTGEMAQNCTQAFAEMSSVANAGGAAAAEGAAGAVGALQGRAAAEAAARAQAEAQGAARAALEHLCAALRQAMAAQDLAERRFLQEDFRATSPTGRTPLRRAFRYPRRLRTRSPGDDECLVVENEGETSGSEASEASEPAEAPALLPPVLKCASETDIDVRQRQERSDKENANATMNRSMSFKKPSKLPAPCSRKKPLNERN